MTNIILCGGNGTRLWPLSRTLMPKQFIKLFDNKSLFQMTLERNSKVCNDFYIVSNQEQYFLALDQSEEIDTMKNQANSYILEPLGKNTAPAIALSCFGLDKDEIVLVSPADHLIKNELEYVKILNKAQALAKKGNLVTFGIKPKSAEVGYGYIEAKGEDVLAFHEKPDIQTAKKYLKAQNYYWNSGIFCFKAGVFLEELKKYSPKIYQSSLEAFSNSKLDGKVRRILSKDMDKIPENSIDYAVMEKSSLIKVVLADISWNDVGSFDALYNELPHDKAGNTNLNNHFSIDSANNLIYSHKRTIATLGIEDCIIVDTDDALLISKKGKSNQIKDLLKIIKKENKDLAYTHLKVHRPWGTYEVLEDTPGYKIKKIIVKPNKRLSLQKHFHRNEHWTVVSGTATIQIGENISLLRPNESTYIKMGEMHRLSNKGKIPVVLIEAQVGEYTGEDDIVRFDDDFSRV